MRQFLFKRLLLVLPTLLIISVATFLLAQYLTDDPLTVRGAGAYPGQTADPEVEAAFAAQQARNLHLDKPVFYFSLGAACLPDTLHLIFPYQRRTWLRQLALLTNDWPKAQDYAKALAATIRAKENLPDSAIDHTAANRALGILKQVTVLHEIDTQLVALQSQPALSTLPATQQLMAARAALQVSTAWGLPVIHGHGTNNQYHDWLTRRYAHEAISPWKLMAYPLRVTLFINAVAFLLAFGLGIPLGIWSGSSERWGSRSQRWILFLYIIPVLLLGCGLRYLFATPGHGLYLSAIGGVGTSVFDASRIGFWSWVAENLGRLILPIITLGFHVMAAVALQMLSGVMDVYQQEFITAARARGIGEKTIRRRYAFFNALGPIIVMIGHLLPALVSGSILIEYIFNVNGLGGLIIDAVHTNQYELLMTIVLMTSVLTVLGSLLADLLLAAVDVRVREGFLKG